MEGTLDFEKKIQACMTNDNLGPEIPLLFAKNLPQQVSGRNSGWYIII